MSGPLRSLLFVPGDSERKQTRALATPADALILDLEDSVAPVSLPAARAQVAALLRSPQRAGQQRWVRVNGPGSGQLLQDLAAVVGPEAAPAGIVLPKISQAAQIVEVSHYLAALEAAFGHVPGTIRLLVIATETPRAVLGLAQYAEVLTGPVRARLAGLTWGMEDLGAALGVRAREVEGVPTFPFQLARAQCLLAAASLEVPAIDGVYTRHTDTQGLVADLAIARRDGFLGKLAIHPAQVEPINAAFTPAPEELAHARAVVAAFAQSGGSGVVSLEGRMLDRPHLLAAQRLLAAAAQ